MTAPPHDLRPVTRCCVASGVTSQRDILKFKPIFLRKCAFHSELWRCADKRAKE